MSSANTYLDLCLRIKAAIENPKAQREQQVQVAKHPHEAWCDWERMIEELEITEGVNLKRISEDQVDIFWYAVNYDEQFIAARSKYVLLVLD